MNELLEQLAIDPWGHLVLQHVATGGLSGVYLLFAQVAARLSGLFILAPYFMANAIPFQHPGRAGRYSFRSLSHQRCRSLAITSSECQTGVSRIHDVRPFCRKLWLTSYAWLQVKRVGCDVRNRADCCFQRPETRRRMA